jgi:hypothetical protein
MRYRKVHPITANMHRIIDVRSLARHGAFKRPMRFPFQHLESAPDHIKVFRVGDKSRQTPQIIAVTWRPMTFGLKPFFICPRCNKRRCFLYFDTLAAYCRCCAGLWFRSQQVRIRTRLLHRSHRIRVKLGDEHGKPGDNLPARPYLQTHRRYDRIIAKLKQIEDSYRYIVTSDRRHYRQRDEYGRYLPSEASADSHATDDLGQ